jgi:hypothetical protein
MIFPYWESWQEDEVRFLPLLPIRVWHGRDSLDIDALVDSGAEHTVLSVEIAEELGIDLSDADDVTVVAAGGGELDGWKTTVTFQLSRRRCRAPAIFSETGKRRAILGQVGFFAYFTVTFRYRKREMDIRRARS